MKYRVLLGVVTIILTCTSITWSQQAEIPQQVWQHAGDSVLRRLSNTYLHVLWAKEAPLLYYHIDLPNGDVEHHIVDLKRWQQSDMVPDHEAFYRTLEEVLPPSTNTRRLHLYHMRFDKGDGSRFRFRHKDKWYSYDKQNGSITEVEAPHEKRAGRALPPSLCISKDSLVSVVGKCMRTYFVPRDSSDTTLLPNIDQKKWVTVHKGKGMHRCTPLGRWYGHKYISLVRTQVTQGEMAFVRSLTQPRPEVVRYAMPMPGEDNAPEYALYLYDHTTRQGGCIDVSCYPDQEVSLAPYTDDKRVYFTRIPRDGSVIDLCYLDVETGKVQVLIHEDMRPHYNLTLFNYHILKSGNILWWSERSGYGAYYLYEGRTGKLLRRVTQGSTLVAGRILHIDKEEREIIFEGYGGIKGEHPQYAHHYRASLLGKRAQKCLNPAAGHHEVDFSEDKRYMLDKCSRMDMPPIYTLIDTKDSRHKPLELHRISHAEAKQAGWVPPRLITLTAADDSTQLHGIMYLPSYLDTETAAKLPIISYVYPGPQSDQMPLGWEPDENSNQTLAECGFVVVQIPSRGSSPHRGRAFYTYGYGNLRDYPLLDNKHAIEQLSQQYSFIDLNRVGIYGHSGGGFHAVTSMLTYPDFYKVCVAASGNYDNNIYIRWWAESFNAISYSTDSKGKRVIDTKVKTPMELVGHLRGPLLLMTGDEDRNVSPSHTWRLVNALIKADKDFDLVVFPGKEHQLDSPYYFNKIKRYFLQHL